MVDPVVLALLAQVPVLADLVVEARLADLVVEAELLDLLSRQSCSAATARTTP